MNRAQLSNRFPDEEGGSSHVGTEERYPWTQQPDEEERADGRRRRRRVLLAQPTGRLESALHQQSDSNAAAPPRTVTQRPASQRHPIRLSLARKLVVNFALLASIVTSTGVTFHVNKIFQNTRRKKKKKKSI